MRRHFNVISTATTQFSGTSDPLTLAPTPSDYVEHHQVQTGSSNNLATETDIDAISVAIPMFWGKVFTGVYSMSTLPEISFPQKFQDGRRIPEVVITLRQKMIPR